MCDSLPLLEDIEITDSHILFVAHRVQGGAVPGGCDPSHWRDVLLRFGEYNSRLHDSVGTLAHRLLNGIVTGSTSGPWLKLANWSG